MRDTAIILTNSLLGSVFAKTTHGIVRGPSRYRILGVVDPGNAGADAGVLLDGKHRGIPVFETVSSAVSELPTRPDVCVLGVATPGGVLPSQIRASLVDAAKAGMSLVNGLHQLLSDDPELVEIASRNGTRLIDIRKPRPMSELRFWSGEVLKLPVLRVPVLGTDWASGKRTTASQLRRACEESGIKAEMIYTGQTGWLQGFKYGFILDATLNDFVTGELEGAILDCYRDTKPDVIFIEGQAALRNPAGPCGSEMIISAGASGVILQHAPARKYVEDYEELGYPVPKVDEEIQLIRLLGADVWAVTLNDHGMEPGTLESTRAQLEEELQVPVLHPLKGGMPRLVEIVKQRLAEAPGLKITAVETWRQDVDLARPYTIATRTITAVELFFVKISSDQGLAGLGSASPAEGVTGESYDACAAALAPERLAWLEGRDPRHLGALCRQLQTTMPSTPAARAALDMALHDLFARLLGVPLVDVLGRCHDVLPTSITVGIQSTEQALAETEEYLGRGFRCLKIKVGLDLEEDLDRLTRLRELAGPEVTIRIDANQGYDTVQALRFHRATADLDLELVEQPLAAAAVAQMRALPAELRSIVAADESLLSEADALTLAQEPPACGIFNIKLMKCGGVTPALAIARLAETAGIELMWGCNDESAISIAAALHAAYACPSTRYLDLDGSFDLGTDPASGGFAVEDGALKILDEPGLGVRLDPTAMG